MDLLHMMATTHPTRVMEATSGRPAARHAAARAAREGADASTVASRLRAALTGRVRATGTVRPCPTC
jgi:hypothetical protein